jgi:arylformamidase
MCEGVTQAMKGWKGWIDVPPPKMTANTERWIEASHVITENLSRAPSFPQPRIRRIRSIPESMANVTELHMVAHHGTHLDAPSHFITDGPNIDEIPLERLYGQGVVWRIEVEPYQVIEPKHLEACRPKLQPGDIVLLDTGWAKHVNTEPYEQHAHLDGPAAEWLARNGCKLLAIDCSTPDLTGHRRTPDFDYPVHHTLLGQGVLIAEHLTNVAPLAEQRVDVMFCAINIGGSDGAPARVLVRATP